MSFFAGVLNVPNGRVVDIRHPRLRAALRLDSGARLWHSPEEGILSHSQSIVTREDLWENLPLVFAGGRKVLVFDGRLDNREELIESLYLHQQADGPIPDGAIVSAAIERWGDDACCHLVGDFAIACWDIGRRRLLLASDHTGGRVIFYHATRDGIVFATRMDAIWSLPGISSDVDLQCIARLLLDCTPDAEATPFRTIRLLPAASRLIWSAGDDIKLNRYWTPNFATRIRYVRDEDYVDHARELLDTAVRCRLRAIGPIACQLSGGFDSAGVTATAAKLMAPHSILSVTAVPQPDVPALPGSARAFVDEWEHAGAVARMHPNIEAHVAPAEPPKHVDPRHLFHVRGTPVRNFLNVSWFGAANQKVRELGARVLLAGTSGNLTLSWSGNRRPTDLASSGHLWSLSREIRGLSRRGVRRPWQAIRRDILPQIVSPPLRRAYGWVRGASTPDWGRTSAISSELALAANAEAIAQENIGCIPGLGHDASSRLRHFESNWRRPGNPLLRPYLGFDRRDPLGDIRLVEFCISLPSDQYMLDGVTRRLARRVLADRVPEQLLRENRKGRQNPDWFYRLSCEREQFAESIERLKKSPLASYALDLPRMKNILEDWPADADDAERKLTSLVAVLARGVNTGEFLEWVESGCIPPPSV